VGLLEHRAFALRIDRPAALDHAALRGRGTASRRHAEHRRLALCHDSGRRLLPPHAQRTGRATGSHVDQSGRQAHRGRRRRGNRVAGRGRRRQCPMAATPRHMGVRQPVQHPQVRARPGALPLSQAVLQGLVHRNAGGCVRRQPSHHLRLPHAAGRGDALLLRTPHLPARRASGIRRAERGGLRRAAGRLRARGARHPRIQHHQRRDGHDPADRLPVPAAHRPAHYNNRHPGRASQADVGLCLHAHPRRLRGYRPLAAGARPPVRRARDQTALPLAGQRHAGGHAR